ncbi:hypothetical protein ACETK3_21220, partial [Arthrobacter sp. E44]|uniref:hypothetical protein n=1 Tax=Arthrobacter sp. E44 TaxID=3341794 RepID=UPI0035A73B86
RVPQRRQLQIGYSLEKCRQDGGMTLIPGIHFPTNREEPVKVRLQFRTPQRHAAPESALLPVAAD